MSSPVIKLDVKGEPMDSPNIREKGSKCPNEWVFPSFAMKIFLLAYIITHLVQVGTIKNINKALVKYNFDMPIAKLHPLREYCKKIGGPGWNN